MAASKWRQQIKDLDQKDILTPFSLRKIFKTVSTLLSSTPKITFLDLNAEYQSTIFAGEILCSPNWQFYGIVPSEKEERLPLERSKGNIKIMDLQRISSISLPSIHCIFNYWVRLNPQEVIQSVRLAILTNTTLFVIPKVRILKELIKLCCVTTLKVLNFDGARITMCFFEIKDKLSEIQRMSILTWCNQYLTGYQERNIALVF